MRKIIYIVIFLMLASCTSRTIYKKPKIIIEKDEMIRLWTDIFIANGARNVTTKESRRNVNYLPFLLEKYNIDSTRFMQSNIYYTSKAETYKKMLKKVEENLIMLKNEHDPKMKGIDPNLPAHVKDSIALSRDLHLKEELDEKAFK